MARYCVLLAVAVVLASGGHCATVTVSPDDLHGWARTANRNGLGYFTAGGPVLDETAGGFPSGRGAFYAICMGGGTSTADKTPDTVWIGLDTYNGQPLAGVALNQIKTLEYTAYVSDFPSYQGGGLWKYPREPMTLQFVATDGTERVNLWFRPWGDGKPEGGGYGGRPAVELGRWNTYDCINCTYHAVGSTSTMAGLWSEPESNAKFTSWANLCATYGAWTLVATAPVGDIFHSAGWDGSTTPPGSQDLTSTATGMALNFEVGARKFQYNGIWGATKATNWFPESIYFKGYLDTFKLGIDYGTPGSPDVVETTYDFEPAAITEAPRLIASNNRAIFEGDWDPAHTATTHRIGYAAIWENVSGMWQRFRTRVFGVASNSQVVMESNQTGPNLRCVYFDITDYSQGVPVPITVRASDPNSVLDIQNGDYVAVTGDVRHLPWGLIKLWYVWSCAANVQNQTYP